jgi:hypothetical protein
VVQGLQRWEVVVLEDGSELLKLVHIMLDVVSLGPRIVAARSGAADR